MARCDEIGHTWTERGDPVGSSRIWCAACRLVPDLLLAIHERDLLRMQLQDANRDLSRLKEQLDVQGMSELQQDVPDGQLENPNTTSESIDPSFDQVNDDQTA